MKLMNIQILLCLLLVACQSSEDLRGVDVPSSVTSRAIDKQKQRVPISINLETGYSWHKHLDTARNAKIGLTNNQVENMIESQDSSMDYVDAIENVQDLTRSAKKWVVVQNWAGKNSAKMGFAVLNDKGWVSGFVHRSGEVETLAQPLFMGNHFSQLIALKPFVCTSNIIHVNTLSVSFGDSGDQKDFNFYDEIHTWNGSVKCTHADGELAVLRGIAELYSFGG